MAKEKKSSKEGIHVTGAFIAGAVLATIAGGYYLFGSKNAKQNRKNVEAWTVRAKGEVLTKIEKAKKLTKEEYEKVVDSVLDKYSNVKEISENKVDSLRKELKKHWKEIKAEADALESKGKRKVVAVKKALKK